MRFSVGRHEPHGFQRDVLNLGFPLADPVSRIDPGNLHRLLGSASWPINLNRFHLGSPAQADLQSEGISTETASGVAGAMDDSIPIRRRTSNSDACSDARAVRCPTFQLQLDPMIFMAGVLQERVGVLVSMIGPS